MLLDRLVAVMERMKGVSMGNERVIGGGIILARFLQPCGFQVALGSLLMMLGGILVMRMVVFCVGHEILLIGELARRALIPGTRRTLNK
jgi:hypothetical protein